MLKQTLLTLSLFASPALADGERLLLQKAQDAGHTMQHYYQSFTCNIYADHVETVRHFAGQVVATETRAITLTGDIAALIQSAMSETFVSEGTMCDAPSTRITALSPFAESPLLLYGLSTCSQDGTRTGAKSTILLNIANSLCGEMR